MVSIYKSCDIRGRFGSELTGAHARRLGSAIGLIKGRVKVLVGGDGRNSTPELKAELVNSLVDAGCDVIDLGQVPTPLFYFARGKLGVETGVMVTASHNPAADNGFKVTLGPMPITIDEMKNLSRLMESGAEAPFGSGSVLSVRLDADYSDFLRRFAPDLSGMRIVVDCAHGMAGPFAQTIWAQTGAKVDLLNCEVDGNFPAHPPNPADARNLAQLCRAVVDCGADLGVAYDGDGDRVGFVDPEGNPVANDAVIVLFSREMLRNGPETIVYDQKCSRVVADEVRAMGGIAVRELSGHTFIKRAFIERNAVYAGELSGHHFFRSVHGDDGLAASLIFSGLVHQSGTGLKGLLATVPKFAITPDLRIPMQPEEIRQLVEDLEAGLAGQAFVTRTDGLRIELSHGWGLVRPSVTEPVVTMRFEARDQASLDEILSAIENASPLLFGKLRGLSKTG